MHRASKDNLDKGNGLRNTVTPAWLKMQEAFQPGATPPQRGKRRFLCYNMLGTITTVENDGYSHIEVEYPISQFISQFLLVFGFFSFQYFLLHGGGINSNMVLRYIPGFMLNQPRDTSQFLFPELLIDISS